MTAKIILNRSAINNIYNNDGVKHLTRLGSEVVSIARTYVAVRTGALRDSIMDSVDTSNMMVYVGSDLPYAMKEELRHPYLRPALVQVVNSRRGI